MSARRFIRFELLARHSDSGEPAGFFTVIYDFQENSNVSQSDIARIDELRSWFSENLDKPDRFTSSTSKGAWRRATRGISWFKSDAQDHIAKAREYCAIIREYGYETKQVETMRPGKIIYEDDFQIVAESFRDTRR